MKETIGEYIHSLRTKSGMTLTKLAAALDIDQSTLSKIENGKRNIPKTILPKLASIFELELKELEFEFCSELVAELIYIYDEPSKVLQLAEEKARYIRIKKEEQRKLDF